MRKLGTITYRKHPVEADLMGRSEGPPFSNRQETLRASSHPASRYVQGDFAIAVGDRATVSMAGAFRGGAQGLWFLLAKS